MNKLADLHIHTNFSDSTSSPQEVVEQAYKEQLSCISITDHDIVDGIQPAIDAAQQYGIEVIPGIELSSEMNGKDIHILGYCIDYQSDRLQGFLKVFQNSRLERMKKMIMKLKEAGINNVELDDVLELSKDGALGRPHLASVLVNKGIVTSLKSAFEKYLAEGEIAYMPKFGQTPFDAIKLIIESKGVAVLAHPMFTCVDELIPQFVAAGLKGLEVHYANIGDNVFNFYSGIAKKHNLLITGGSDAHGNNKKNTYLGKIKIPYELVEKLKEYASSKR